MEKNHVRYFRYQIWYCALFTLIHLFDKTMYMAGPLEISSQFVCLSQIPPTQYQGFLKNSPHHSINMDTDLSKVCILVYPMDA